jgi:hypothetical protein
VTASDAEIVAAVRDGDRDAFGGRVEVARARAALRELRTSPATQ